MIDESKIRGEEWLKPRFRDGTIEIAREALVKLRPFLSELDILTLSRHQEAVVICPPMVILTDTPQIREILAKLQ